MKFLSLHPENNKQRNVPDIRAGTVQVKCMKCYILLVPAQISGTFHCLLFTGRREKNFIYIFC